jgi:hypothetical protein
MAAAFAEHADLIAGEVLAASMAESDAPADLAFTDPDVGFSFSVFRV